MGPKPEVQVRFVEKIRFISKQMTPRHLLLPWDLQVSSPTAQPGQKVSWLLRGLDVDPLGNLMWC